MKTFHYDIDYLINTFPEKLELHRAGELLHVFEPMEHPINPSGIHELSILDSKLGLLALQVDIYSMEIYGIDPYLELEWEAGQMYIVPEIVRQNACRDDFVAPRGRVQTDGIWSCTGFLY